MGTIAPVYEGTLTLRDARKRYFDAWGFGDGGYEAKWVELKKVAGVPIGFPNSDGRRRAVKLHDLHHVLTGYAADWTGEAEIGAWELGAGCGRHYAAWILNLLALQYGLFIAPRKVLAAVARGRRSRSLYAAPDLDESMLDRNVAEVRAETGLDRDPPAPGAGDALALAGLWLAGLALWTTPYALAGLAWWALG